MTLQLNSLITTILQDMKHCLRLRRARQSRDENLNNGQDGSGDDNYTNIPDRQASIFPETAPDTDSEEVRAAPHAAEDLSLKALLTWVMADGLTCLPA
jgi:hypothetical protein